MSRTRLVSIWRVTATNAVHTTQSTNYIVLCVALMTVVLMPMATSDSNTSEMLPKLSTTHKTPCH